MANKFPLILNTSANQIQEIASGDNLDLTGCGINNAGVITATSFSGNITGNVTGNADTCTTATRVTVWPNNSTNATHYITFADAVSGSETIDTDTGLTYNPSSGNLTSTQFTGTLQTAAQTNITSVGTLSSLNVSGNVSIGGTLTYEDVTNIDSVGLITARNGITVSAGTATFQGAIDANSDLDVDGHTNLDNVSIAGIVTISGTAPNLLFTETDANPDWGILCSGGQMKLQDMTNTANILTLDDDKIQAVKNLDALAGVDVTGNLTVSGDATFNGGAGAITISANSDIRMPTGSWTGDYGAKIQSHDNYLFLQGGSNGVNLRNAGGTRQLNMSNDGHFGPSNGQAYNLGSSALPWTNSYQKFIDVDSASSTNNHALANFNGNATSGNMAGLKIHYYECGSDDNRSGLYWQHENVGNHRMWMDDAGFLRQKGSNPTSDTDGNAYVKLGVSNPSGNLTITGQVTATRVDSNGQLHVAYPNATNTNYMSSLSNNNGIMHLFRGDGLYIGNNMNTSNQAGGPNNKAITLGTNGTIQTTGAITVTTSGADANGVVIQNSAGLKLCVDTAKTVNMDARVNGGSACILHKWNSPNLAGGSYEPYQEKWYDGDSYHSIKSANNQFEFDSPLKSVGNSANFTTEESGGASVEIRSGGAEGYIGTRTNHPIRFVTYSSSAGNGGRRWEINANGDFIPIANDTYEIGSSSSRVKTAYIQDINIKNEVYAGTTGGDTSLWNNTTAGDRGWNWQDGASLGTFSICNNSQYSAVYLNKITAGGVSDNRWIDFRWDGSQVGTIKYSSNDVIINQESDYRLKENVVGITDGIAKVKQLNPVKFNFKSDAKGKDPSILNEGFLAHELQSVIPQAAYGVKDATKVDEEGQTVPDYQGIWMPKMIPILTAALKEAITKIETLEAKVAALESS